MELLIDLGEENRGWEGVLWAMRWGKYVLEHKFFVGVMC